MHRGVHPNERGRDQAKPPRTAPLAPSPGPGNKTGPTAKWGPLNTD